MSDPPPKDTIVKPLVDDYWASGFSHFGGVGGRETLRLGKDSIKISNKKFLSGSLDKDQLQDHHNHYHDYDNDHDHYHDNFCDHCLD